MKQGIENEIVRREISFPEYKSDWYVLGYSFTAEVELMCQKGMEAKINSKGGCDGF